MCSCALPLCRLKESGLLGYTTENNTLILCVKSSSNPLSRDRIPKIIKDEFKSIKINEMEQLFTVHCGITSGQKLYYERDNAGSYGTLGMIGSFNSTEENETRCCISSPHVISEGQVAYSMDATRELGCCIWPPPAQEGHVNVQDISVISLKANVQGFTLLGKVGIFDEVERSKLDKRKVFKYGATTDKTVGIVCKTNLWIPKENPQVEAFLIEPYDKYEKNNKDSKFSKPGDSGAVVLTKFGSRFFAFSMILGGDVNIDGVAKNCSIAVELKDAIIQFEKASGKILKLNTL